MLLSFFPSKDLMGVSERPVVESQITNKMFQMTHIILQQMPSPAWPMRDGTQFVHILDIGFCCCLLAAQT
jgi:hypothetical protein